MLRNHPHPLALVLALGMLMLLSSLGALVSIQRGTVGARPDRGEVRTWYVDGDGNAEYVKIQDAIDTAGEGDTIRVWEGTYYENVVVDKSIDLIGNGSETTTIDGGGSGDVVRITADRVGMGGFIVTGSGSWHAGMRIESNYNRIFENNCTSNYYGILLDSCFNNILSNNTCSSKEYGISLKHSGNNILIRNTCFDNEYGVTIVSNSNNNTISRGICTSNRVGILVDRDSNGNTVSKNICIDNQKGISIFGSNIDIINNTCLENEYGISIGSESNKITVSKNICINNTSGIRLESSDHNTISNNSCSSNSKHGIILKDSGNNIICNNTYSSKEYGMYFHNSSNNLLSNNNIMENKVGIYFFHFSDKNIVHYNKIFDNTEYGICFYSSNGNTLSNNTITGNDVGIFLHDSSKKNSAHYNSIYSNPDYAVEADYNDGLDIHATQNYWGDPSGPHHPTKNPAGKGDGITDFVDFEPWLCAQYNEDYYNGRLSGHVTDAFNSPLENVEVRVEGHKTFRLAFSDENGYYSISKLPICNCTKKVIASEEGYRDFEREVEIGENTILTIILIPENQPPVLTILSPKNNSEASGKIL
ncbi:MAG: right-handed parallel beta-helix repeat-containing protein, partial [Thermoplasmata archaeon]|nr:right-handed parallel beta-helix repeat-containing protein [Thermoplasmata archaeon]